MDNRSSFTMRSRVETSWSRLSNELNEVEVFHMDVRWWHSQLMQG